MDQISDETAKRVIDELREQLAKGEDAETAIAVYKLATWLIGQLEEIKASALDLAERDMQKRDVEALKTPIGSAGWTEPRGVGSSSGSRTSIDGDATQIRRRASCPRGSARAIHRVASVAVLYSLVAL